jgi:hypothetical protein
MSGGAERLVLPGERLFHFDQWFDSQDRSEHLESVNAPRETTAKVSWRD